MEPMTPRGSKLERQISWLRDQRAHLERVGDLTEDLADIIDDEIKDLRGWQYEERCRDRGVPDDGWPEWERRADLRIERFDLDRLRMLVGPELFLMISLTV